MEVDIPIRGTPPGKVQPRLSKESQGQSEDFVAHARNNGSPLNESSPHGSNGHGTDREEQLFRLVDILRTEQVAASIKARAEVSKTGHYRWRGPCLLAVVVILAGAAAILQASRPTDVYSDVRPGLPPELGHPIQSNLTAKVVHGSTSVTNVSQDKPIPSSLIAPLPKGRAEVNPLQSPPITDYQVTNRLGIAEDATPLEDSIAETKPVDLPAPTLKAASPARSPLPAVIGDASEAQTNKPALVVYLPRGSLRAETKARSLSVRIDFNLAKSDFEIESALPDEAVIKFSPESNHKLARLVGKSLGDLGYRWRIENGPSPFGVPRNMIEVWLPR